MKTSTGTLYGIGVGPGDPEWITFKAHRILTSTPVIAYPKSRPDRESYALNIVKEWIDPDQQEQLPLLFPMDGGESVRRAAREEAARRLWQPLREGRDVAFITEGDPLMYSTFIHVMTGIKAQGEEVPIRVIPGVSSVHGAAACLQLPLAEGEEKIAILPAPARAEELEEWMRTHDTVVLLKVAKVLDSLIDVLSQKGWLEKACVMTRVSTREEVVCHDLSELKGRTLPYFTLMILKKDGQGRENPWASRWREERSI
ncbi:precorrin-2 C(20)-methyltransferase [Paludifilum halophilum]|nr:precorrin-2 C(20)-methyltransferase [Paludifilum halophilum]